VIKYQTSTRITPRNWTPSLDEGPFSGLLFYLFLLDQFFRLLLLLFNWFLYSLRRFQTWFLFLLLAWAILAAESSFDNWVALSFHQIVHQLLLIRIRVDIWVISHDLGFFLREDLLQSLFFDDRFAMLMLDGFIESHIFCHKLVLMFSIFFLLEIFV
jgi:hypothetical protein